MDYIIIGILIAIGFALAPILLNLFFAALVVIAAAITTAYEYLTGTKK